MTKTCALCGSPLHTGNTYCSRKCAALARSEKIKTMNVLSERDNIPEGMQRFFRRQFGDAAKVVMNDARELVVELEATPAPPTEGRTEGGYPPGEAYVIGHLALGDYRPEDSLSFPTIELMKQNGQVMFATMLKKAPVRTVFRNSNSWRIDSREKSFAERVTANMELIFPSIIDDIMTCMEYGVAFGEMRWHNIKPEQIGLHGNARFTALRAIDFCYPETIQKINRDSKYKFNGFQQKTTRNGYYDVPRDQALVVTYDKVFRNMWGRSYYRPMHVAWYWYEIVWRCFLRFLERQATPVVRVKAPQRSQVELKDGTIVSAMDHALVLAADIAKSNSVAVPSDVDADSGKPLWELDYLASENRSSIFINALEVLGTQILRAGLLADRVATQESATGSYNIASVHYIMTRLDDERILDALLGQLNEFLFPKFSLYNYGANGPSLLMKTEGLDIEEKQRIFQLLLKMADAKHPDLQRIDIARTLDIENVPMMSDEEFKKFKEEQQKEAEEKVKMQQAAMAAKPKGTPFPEKGDKQQALENLVHVQVALSSGSKVPVYVTTDALEQLEASTKVEYVED